MGKKPKFADLHGLDEDKRIEVIGDIVITGKVVAFIVDTEGDDGNAKADRYIGKLKKIYPSLRVVERFAGPVAQTVTVKVSL